MNKDEALRIALEALGILKSCKSIEIWCGAADEAVDAIKEALAQPDHVEGTLTMVQPAQEPVAWINKDHSYVALSDKSTVYGSHTIPLYTAPPRKEWISLTEKAAELVYEDVSGQSLRPQDYRLVLQFAVAIDAKLKELNT
jgi:hypothetical protein